MSDFDFETQADEQRAQQEAAALERAQLHAELFLRHPAGKALLADWDAMFMKQRVDPGSSIDAYARAEAMRSFLQAIHDYIEMAQKGLLRK